MKKESTLTTDVKVKTLPEMSVAYVRHIGPYKGDVELFGNLWGRLMRWAGPRGLMQQDDLKCLCVYHDSPEITDEAKLRTSVCITIPEETQVDGEVGKMKIEEGQYALGHFEIDADQYEEAWNFMYGHWLPDSGFQPDDRPAFEMCLNNPDEHPEKKHEINICVPVKPL
jgi:AraC family transcriptional regulator